MGKGPLPSELVHGRREQSVESINRAGQPLPDPPGLRPPPRQRRMQARSDDDLSDDYAYYRARRNRGRGRRASRNAHSDDDEPSPERKKSAIEEAAGVFGLGGLAAKYLGGKSSSDERKEGDGKSKTGRNWTQAAQATAAAAAIEAFRSRNEPGQWDLTGSKVRRVGTAALTAGVIDAFISRKDPESKSKRHIAEAILGGLAATRAVNGARDKGDGTYDDDGVYQPRARSQSVFGRMRSMSRRRRSMSRGSEYYSDEEERGQQRGRRGSGAKGILTGAGVAFLGKAILDRVRSISKGRSRARSESRSRSRSRARSFDSSTRSSSASSYDAPDRGQPRGSSDNYGKKNRARESANNRAPHKVRNAVGAAGLGAAAGALAANPRGVAPATAVNNSSLNEPQPRSLSSSSSSMSEIENKRKRMRGKELLTAGLATVATIHAANGVYSSMTAHEKRHKLVEEGKLTVAEARKKQTKAWVQDAAAVGIAALGIKGAFSEWKSMTEQRNEFKLLEKHKRDKKKRAERRQAKREREREIQMAQLSQLPGLLNNPQFLHGMMMGHPMANPYMAGMQPQQPTQQPQQQMHAPA